MHLEHGSNTNNPKLIVLHAMGEYIEWEPDNLHASDFLDKIGLSAHALVCPNGDVMRLREDHEGAWHAKGFNKDSLGIEFLVKGVHTYETFRRAIKGPYLTDAQYGAGLEVVRKWVEDYGITSVKTHSELSPGRKFDPGAGFPITKFLWDI